MSSIHEYIIGDPRLKILIISYYEVGDNLEHHLPILSCDKVDTIAHELVQQPCAFTYI